jgi:hypothetical protein
MSSGQLICGASKSRTVTVWTAIAELPELSVTAHVTTVAPFGKTGGASLTTVATPQLSEVSGVPKLTPVAEHWPGSVLTVTPAGAVMVGDSVSFTVTVKLHVAVLPAASVAMQLTVLAPFGKVEPVGGSHATVTPGALSVAVGAGYCTTAEHCPKSLEATTVAGQTITGGS